MAGNWRTEGAEVIITLFMLFGRYPIAWLISSTSRKITSDKKETKGIHIQCTTGNKIFVEIDGKKDAQAIVMIHGLNSSRKEWYYQRELLASDYKLVLIDLPGHGKSKEYQNLTISSLAVDLKFIIDHLNIRRPVLYGHSMGGMVILEYVRQNLADLQLKGLILQHTTYTDPITTSPFAKLLGLSRNKFSSLLIRFIKLISPIFWCLSFVNYLNGISVVFFRYLYFTGKQSAQQLRLMSWLSVACSPTVVAEALLQMAKYDVSGILNKVQVPTLIFGGKKDRLTNLSASIHMHEEIENSRLKIVGEGHQSMMENSIEVNESLTLFLRNLDVTIPEKLN